MDMIKKLEYDKIFNEIDYLMDDFEIKQKMNDLIFNEYRNELNIIIAQDDIIREQWESLNIPDIDFNRTKGNIINNIKNNDINRNIYRNIVKETHPDKVDDKYLNDIYIKVSESYNNNDLLKVVYYSKKAKIKINLEDIDLTKLIDDTIKLKKEIKMYENSIHFKWYYSDKDEEIIKKDIAKKYLTTTFN